MNIFVFSAPSQHPIYMPNLPTLLLYFMATALCPRCNCVHAQSLRLANRFEQLLLIEVPDDLCEYSKKQIDWHREANEQDEPTTVKKKDGLWQVLQQNQECEPTLKKEMRADGQGDLDEAASGQINVSKIPKLSALIRQNFKQQPKTSLREVMKKALSSSTAVTEVLHIPATSTRQNVKIRDYMLPECKLISQLSFGVEKNSKETIKGTLLDSQRQRKSIENHIARNKSKQMRTSERKKSYDRVRKGSDLGLKENHYSVTSKSVSHLNAPIIRSHSTHISQPSTFTPLLVQSPLLGFEDNYNSLPTPPFMKQYSHEKCTYNDNRCFGFNCGSPNNDINEVIFDDFGHRKAQIYK